MDALLAPLIEATGGSPDQIKLVLCLILSFPLGSLFIRVPVDRPNLRHAFNVAASAFFLLTMLNLYGGFLQLLVDIIGTYYVAKSLKGPYMPWIVFVFAMSHLTINHAIRLVFDYSYETVEITGAQMVLVMKLTTFAWNVYDGQRPVEDLDKWQKEKRVARYPTLLAFLGYCFYFPGLLVGPYVVYSDYANLVDGTLFKDIEKKDDKHISGSGPRRLVPSGRKRVAYRKLLAGIVYLGLFIGLGSQWNFSVSTQDWFAQKPLLWRIAILQFCGFFERSKYYALWTLTEGASILTGLGFSGFGPNGQSRWEDASNIKIWSIEFPDNIKILLDSWNMKTNMWLRECVYKRVTPKGKKPGFRSSMLTFATSALWHGISSGYYLAFLLGGFAQTAGRLCRSNLRPLILPADYVAARGAPPPSQTPKKQLYDLVGIFCSLLMTNYLALPFMLLTWRDSLLGWSRVGWYGHFLVFGSMGFFYLGGAKWLHGVQAARVKAAGGGSKANGGVQPTSGATTPNMQVPDMNMPTPK